MSGCARRVLCGAEGSAHGANTPAKMMVGTVHFVLLPHSRLKTGGTMRLTANHQTAALLLPGVLCWCHFQDSGMDVPHLAQPCWKPQKTLLTISPRGEEAEEAKMSPTIFAFVKRAWVEVAMRPQVLHAALNVEMRQHAVQSRPHVVTSALPP